VPGTFLSEMSDKDHVLTIKIPIELTDITLFLDLLPYILPFGIRVSIVRTTVIKREISLPIGTTSTMRNAFPRTENDHEIFLQHPLGLARISEDASSIDYSETNFVTAKHVDNDPEALVEYEVIAGQLGATPIVAFEPITSTNSLVKDVTDKEETI
jgi:hypothetical protein